MKINLVNMQDDYNQGFDLEASNISQVLAGLKGMIGLDRHSDIMTSPYGYLLRSGEDIICMDGRLMDMDLSEYDELIIVRETEGEAVALGGYLISTFAITGAVAVAATYAISFIVVGVAIGALMSALSPTPQFNSDPSAAQAEHLSSSLFNGPPNIREQGGSVPLIYGTAYAGGVLIAGSVKTEDV